MRVGFGPVGQWNTNRLNQGGARTNGGVGTAPVPQNQRRDTVAFGAKGRMNRLLENLMKQKASIEEQRKSLIGATLEKGGSLDSIKSQLEAYEQQMKNVDEQIAEMMAKEVEKQAEKMRPPDDEGPKTEEEIQNERLANITELSTELSQAKTVSSVKTRVDGQARVLKAEIELDKMHAGSSAGAKEFIAKKEAKLVGVERQSRKLASQIAKKLNDTTEKIAENAKPQDVIKETESGSADDAGVDKAPASGQPAEEKEPQE